MWLARAAGSFSKPGLLSCVEAGSRLCAFLPFQRVSYNGTKKKKIKSNIKALGSQPCADSGGSYLCEGGFGADSLLLWGPKQSQVWRRETVPYFFTEEVVLSLLCFLGPLSR